MNKNDVNIGIAKCPKTGKFYGVRVEKRGKDDYTATWAFPIREDVAKREGFASTGFPKSIKYAAEYPGCPHCEKKENLAELGGGLNGLDLVLVGDLTGSMGEYRDILKIKFMELCKGLFAMIGDLKIGVIFYSDHWEAEPYLTTVHKLTKDQASLLTFISNTPMGDGGDADEAAEDALHDLLHLNWSGDTPRSVVIFGDASPHPAAECPLGRDFFKITEQLYNQKVTINSVYCGKEYGGRQEELQRLENVAVGNFSKKHRYLEPPNFFSWLANVSGGMVFGIDKIDNLLSVIAAAAAKDSGLLDDFSSTAGSNTFANREIIKIAKEAADRRKGK